MIRKTTGWTDEGKQIMTVIGYYHTKVEAMEALVEYNKAPIDPTVMKMTFKELYAIWSKADYKDEIPKAYDLAYRRCESLYDMPFADIKTATFQAIIDDCEQGYSTKKTIKTLLNKMTRYAMANDIITKDYVSLIKMPGYMESRMHMPFTELQLDALWKDSNNPNTQVVLIYIYTGLRPTELCRIEHDNVFLDKKYMMGGMKTKAGKNRVVPIADKILPFVKRLYDKDTHYLLANPEKKDVPMDYNALNRNVWHKVMLAHNMDHKPHDGRHTCATLLSNAEVNDKIIKLILGHASQDVTQRVYTHKTIEQLIEAINLI